MVDYDPRLVDLYDEDNPDGPDHDFYRALADDANAKSILDLGCGTGILTVTFAQAGRTVVGVDPSPNMLAYARRRPGAEHVEWILGDSRDIPKRRFDFAVMTGNVAQHISDDDWVRTLLALHRVLNPGGILAFETRNPAARAWESWDTAERSERETAHGRLIAWYEVDEVAPGRVQLSAHNLFPGSPEVITETVLLSFRDRGTIEDQLEAAGMSIDSVYGGWTREPCTDSSPLLIFVARAR